MREKQIRWIVLFVIILMSSVAAKNFRHPNRMLMSETKTLISVKKKIKKTRSKSKSKIVSENIQRQPVVKQISSDLIREIAALSEAGHIIGPDHFKTLTNRLVELEKNGFPKTEIDKLWERLFPLDPSKVVSISGNNMQADSSKSLPENCNNTKPIFTADVTDFLLIKQVTPPGSHMGTDIKGHSYIWTSGQWVPVYAPVDAVLNSGSYVADNASSPFQYSIDFRVKGNCSITFKFDHIDEVVDSIKKALPVTPKVGDSRTAAAIQLVEFKAGDIIGYTHGTRQAGNWDFGAYNILEEGVLAADNAFGLNRYAICPFDFYPPEKRNQYFALFAPAGSSPIPTEVCRMLN